MIAALAVLLALAVMGSLIVLRRRGGAQAASFDPVALEDAVYSELYGERTLRVLPGREARSAADGSARVRSERVVARGGGAVLPLLAVDRALVREGMAGDHRGDSADRVTECESAYAVYRWIDRV